MSTKESRREIYIKSREATLLDKHEWARLMNLGDGGKNAVSHVIKKENPSDSANHRGVNAPEALASQLLVILKEYGKDVAKIEFDENGMITNIPNIKKVRKRRSTASKTVNDN